MNVFTNQFRIAMNQDKSEVVLNFYQTAPHFTEDTAADASVREFSLAPVEPVANLVMTGQCAQRLAEVLNTLLAKDLTENETAPQP